MSFLSKIELKKQLQQLGIKFQGNYICKSDIERLVAKSNKVSSVFPEKVVLLIAKWLHGGCTWGSSEINLFAKHLNNCDIPQELKVCNEIVYRSIRVFPWETDTLYDILYKNKELKNYDKYPFFSWSTKKGISSLSSSETPHTYRLCFKHKPKFKDVVLNFKKVYLLPEIQDSPIIRKYNLTAQDFDEVLLQPVALNKHNLIKLVYHENEHMKEDFEEQYEEGFKVRKINLESDVVYNVKNGILEKTSVKMVP